MKALSLILEGVCLGVLLYLTIDWLIHVDWGAVGAWLYIYWKPYAFLITFGYLFVRGLFKALYRSANA